MTFVLESDSVTENNIKPFSFDVSTSEHTSNMTPFMLPHHDTEIIENITVLEEKLNLLDDALSDDLKNLYRKIKTSTQEIYIKEWTLFSIDNILEIFNNHKHANINITDLGLRYCGMGHCKAVFYDPQTKLIYYRHDGGSNGWDREERYEALKAYKSDKKIAGLTFDVFMKQINGEQDETYCLF